MGGECRTANYLEVATRGSGQYESRRVTLVMDTRTTQRTGRNAEGMRTPGDQITNRNRLARAASATTNGTIVSFKVQDLRT